MWVLVGIGDASKLERLHKEMIKHFDRCDVAVASTGMWVRFVAVDFPRFSMVFVPSIRRGFTVAR